MVGVAIGADSIAFVQLSSPEQPVPSIRRCDIIPHGDNTPVASLLQQHVHDTHTSGLACRLVLSPSDYQLLLVEAPKVPEEELVEALRWRVKDLLSYPVSDAALDAFLLPEDSVHGDKRMAYVVASRKSDVEKLINTVATAGLDLQSIDISELALRNLVLKVHDDDRAVALVKLTQGKGQLQITKQGNLYLSRHFNLAYNAGLFDELPADALILELQRSLDYFERQMHQPPPTVIYFCGDNISDDKLTPVIRESLPGDKRVIELEGLFDISDDAQMHLLPLCLDALGGALRETGA